MTAASDEDLLAVLLIGSDSLQLVPGRAMMARGKPPRDPSPGTVPDSPALTCNSPEASKPMSDCVFCQIVAGESPASIFYRDQTVMGLMTIGPVTPGHAMVIPLVHAASLADLDEGVGRRLWMVTQRTVAALRASDLRCEGVNLFLADGEAAFQDVFHVHMHVFPRYSGDGFDIVADGYHKPPRSELDRAAEKIRSAYERQYGPQSAITRRT